jgi:hypothetical protein
MRQIDHSGAAAFLPEFAEHRRRIVSCSAEHKKPR